MTTEAKRTTPVKARGIQAETAGGSRSTADVGKAAEQRRTVQVDRKKTAGRDAAVTEQATEVRVPPGGVLRPVPKESVFKRLHAQH
eukprot:1378258-Amphidinium_carterae.1